MNDRLLKESDVIEAFKGRESLIHDVYTATAIIKSVPTADRPQEWIPCSERLPEENDVYLVTAMLDYGDGRICRSEELAEYEPDPFLVAGGKWYIDGLPCGLDGTVTAWQPLPKPWKGTDDGE